MRDFYHTMNKNRIENDTAVLEDKGFKCESACQSQYLKTHT